MRKKLFTFALVAALSLSYIPTNISASIIPAQSSNINQSNDAPKNMDDSIMDNSIMDVVNKVITFEPYIETESSGEIRMTATADEIGVSQEEYDNFQNGIELANQYINNGTYTLDTSGQQLSDFEILSRKPTTSQNNIPTIGLSVSYHWYGWRLKLSESETQKLVKALAVGSAGTWLAAELSAAGVVSIPASIPLGIIAASGGVGAAVITAADQGKGISIYYNTTTKVGWIWGN